MRSRPLDTARLLLRACHPEPTAAVSGLTALLAVDAGLSLGRGVLVSLAVLTGQLTIGWSNDLIDARRDRAVQRADKPLATGALPESLVRLALAIALTACVVLSLLCGPWAGLVHLVLGVGAGLAYNGWLKRTVLSFLTYAVAFAILPAVVWLTLEPARLPPVWMMAAGALLGVGAHLVNALPDLADDARTGVRGLPHALGRARSQVLATGVLLAGSVVVVLGPAGRTPWWAWLALAATAGLAAAGLVRSGLAFRATIGIAAVDVVLLVLR